ARGGPPLLPPCPAGRARKRSSCLWTLPKLLQLVVTRASGLAHALAGSRAHHRVQIVVVGSATTEIARQRVPHLVARRRRILVEQRDGRHDLTRRAETALRAELVDHRLLNLVQLAVRALEAFDREHCTTAHRVRQRRAR